MPDASDYFRGYARDIGVNPAIDGATNVQDALEADAGGGGTNVPIGDATGYALDTTTYDNPVTSVGKLATAVFPVDTVGFAFAIEGDAFPRWLFLADGTDGLYVGDGTFDPYSGAAALSWSSFDGTTHLSGRNGKANLGGEIIAGAGTIGFFLSAGVTQPDDIPDAVGGTVVDVEARAALNALLAVLRVTDGLGFLNA